VSLRQRVILMAWQACGKSRPLTWQGPGKVNVTVSD
jgi:hypothetical protein